jgi:hypothetical protein
LRFALRTCELVEDRARRSSAVDHTNELREHCSGDGKHQQRSDEQQRTKSATTDAIDTRVTIAREIAKGDHASCTAGVQGMLSGTCRRRNRGHGWRPVCEFSRAVGGSWYAHGERSLRSR